MVRLGSLQHEVHDKKGGARSTCSDAPHNNVPLENTVKCFRALRRVLQLEISF